MNDLLYRTLISALVAAISLYGCNKEEQGKRSQAPAAREGGEDATEQKLDGELSGTDCKEGVAQGHLCAKASKVSVTATTKKEGEKLTWTFAATTPTPGRRLVVYHVNIGPSLPAKMKVKGNPGPDVQVEWDQPNKDQVPYGAVVVRARDMARCQVIEDEATCRDYSRRMLHSDATTTLYWNMSGGVNSELKAAFPFPYKGEAGTGLSLKKSYGFLSVIIMLIVSLFFGGLGSGVGSGGLGTSLPSLSNVSGYSGVQSTLSSVGFQGGFQTSLSTSGFQTGFQSGFQTGFQSSLSTTGYDSSGFQGGFQSSLSTTGFQGGFQSSLSTTGYDSTGFQGGFAATGFQGGFQSSLSSTGFSSGFQSGFSSTGFQGGFSSTGFQGGFQSGFSTTGFQTGFSSAGFQGGFSSTGFQGGFSSTGFQGGFQSGFSSTGFQSGFSSTGFQSGFSSAGFQSGFQSTGFQGGFQTGNTSF